MDYTKNYHLPQWVKEDRIMMEDFNQMCADIESGIMDARTRAEAGDAAVQKALNTSLTNVQEITNAALAEVRETHGAALTTAQETADAALEKANAAYCSAYKPYACGFYTGAGANQTVTIGFRPSFLILAEQMSSSQTNDYSSKVLAGSEDTCRSFVTFTSTGFIVNYTANVYPQLTVSNRRYAYIAFR